MKLTAIFALLALSGSTTLVHSTPLQVRDGLAPPASQPVARAAPLAAATGPLAALEPRALPPSFTPKLNVALKALNRQLIKDLAVIKAVVRLSASAPGSDSGSGSTPPSTESPLPPARIEDLLKTALDSIAAILNKTVALLDGLLAGLPALPAIDASANTATEGSVGTAVRRLVNVGGIPLLGGTAPGGVVVVPPVGQPAGLLGGTVEQLVVTLRDGLPETLTTLAQLVERLDLPVLEALIVALKPVVEELASVVKDLVDGAGVDALGPLLDVLASLQGGVVPV